MSLPDNDWWIAHTGEYVLGLLDEQDTLVLERVMRHEPGVVKMVADWQESFQPLADSLTPVEPPAHILPALLSDLPKKSSRISGNQADASDADSTEGSQVESIADSSSVMQLLRSSHQSTDRWRAFAGVIVAGCLLFGLYFGWSLT